HGEWSIFHSAVGGIAEGCSQRTVWVRRISLLLFDQCFGIEQKNTGLSIRLWLLRMKWRQSQAQRCSQKIARSELFTSHASSHRACDLPADRLCGMGTASPAPRQYQLQDRAFHPGASSHPERNSYGEIPCPFQGCGACTPECRSCARLNRNAGPRPCILDSSRWRRDSRCVPGRVRLNLRSCADE